MSKDNNSKEDDRVRYDEHGIRLFGPAPEDRDAEDRKHREAQRTYEDKQTALQAGILRTQVALVVFGLIGAGVSTWQAKTAQESSDTAEKSVLLAQKAERDGTRISQMQVQISRDSLRESVENFHSDQRPWIFIKVLQLVRENQAFGDIRYADSFGIRHFTQYCGVYNPDAQDMDQFTTCKGHSYVDRNK